MVAERFLLRNIGSKYKNQQGSDTNKGFCFLGDPAVRPSVPEYKVFTTKINGIDANVFNDTISAMEKVVFRV